MSTASSKHLYEDSERSVDLKYYLSLFQKNLPAITAFFFVALSFGAFYASKIPDTYQATAQVILPNGVPDTMTEADYHKEAGVFKSMAVLFQGVKESRLTEYLTTEKEEEAAYQIQRMLSVSQAQDREGRVYHVSIAASEPQLAANLANAVARAYVRVNFQNSLYHSEEVLKWLPQEADSNEALTIEDAAGEAHQIRRQDLLESLPVFQMNLTLRKLRQKKETLEKEILLLSGSEEKADPRLTEAQTSLEFLKKKIEAEKKEILQNYIVQAQTSYKVPQARILQEAKVPGAPIHVNRYKVVMLIGLAGFFLSLFVVLMVDHFDPTIKNVEDLERKGIAAPFLGYIPLLKSKGFLGKEREFAGHENEISEIAEVFRYIRVAINFSGFPESLKTLAITSCLSHEGKSFTAHNIALSLARDGNKTLLIDADLRCPAIHKRFQVENNNGLSDYLAKDLDYESVFKKSFVENLSLVVAGNSSEHSPELLSSDKMKDFLEKAGKQYDRIIIDCPSLTGINDSVFLGALLGQMILVIATHQTPADLIKKNQKQLEKSRVKLMGVILNRVDAQQERYASYPISSKVLPSRL